MSFSTIFLIALMIAVVISMLIGFFFMLRGSEGDSRKSNTMMMWRVGLQACVLVVLGLLFAMK